MRKMPAVEKGLERTLVGKMSFLTLSNKVPMLHQPASLASVVHAFTFKFMAASV